MGNSHENASSHGFQYNNILKDGRRIKIEDEKNNYNPHRQKDSIAANLPVNLKTYSNVIHIVNEFWLDNMSTLTHIELNNIAALLSSHLYMNCRTSRNMLLMANINKNKKQIIQMPSHSVKIFNIFEYVIRNIINPSNHEKLFQQLQSLGTMHSSYSITNEIYDAMLNAFNYAMEDAFNQQFTLRIRFCFSQLYRVIVDIMTQKDFISILRLNAKMSNETINKLIPNTTKNTLQNTPSPYTPYVVTDIEKDYNLDISVVKLEDTGITRSTSTFYEEIDGFISSLEDCLSDNNGSIYFKKYCEELFCSENFLFHENVVKYRLLNNSTRKKLGRFIINTFIKVGAERQINISGTTRKEIESIIDLTKKLNNDKEKYENIYAHTHTHNKKDTAFQLSSLTDNSSTDISDMVYSFGFTKTLFNKAYDEIFKLMRRNCWAGFRNKILGYCDDKEFVKRQNEKIREKKEEQRKQRKMINAIHFNSKREKRVTINENSETNTTNLVLNNGSVVYHGELKDDDFGHSDIELEQLNEETINDNDNVDDVPEDFSPPIMLDNSTTSIYDLYKIVNFNAEQNLRNIEKIKQKQKSLLLPETSISISPKSELKLPIQLTTSRTSATKLFPSKT